MRRLLPLLLAGCITHSAHVTYPAPAGEAQAAAIVMRVFGSQQCGVPRVYYVAPDCEDASWGHVGPGVKTPKGNCTWGAVEPYNPVIFVAWTPTMTYAASGFADAMWEWWEQCRRGIPDVYHRTMEWTNGLAQRQQDAAVAALRAAGL